MAWNDITITDVGRALLADMINGGKLTITRIAIGSETVSVTELHSQTNVSEPINAPALLAGKSPTEDGSSTVLKIQIRNDEVSESVRMRQIGIYAETDSADEVLLALLQDNIGEEIPSYNEFPQFELNQWITLAISRTNNIAVTIDPTSVVITLEQLNEALKGYVEKADGMGMSENNFTNELKEKYDGAHEHILRTDNPHAVTKAQVGLGNVPDVATNDQTPTYTEAGTLTALTSGEKLSEAFGKISKAVKEFISHFGDNVRHITAAERTAWNGKAAGSHNHSASDINSGTLSISRGGTGNTKGYIITGQKSGTTLGNGATIEGKDNEASGANSHAGGYQNRATNSYAYVGGSNSVASGSCSFSFGSRNEATDNCSVALGSNNVSSGNCSVALGSNSKALGRGSMALGTSTIANNNSSFALGNNVTASANMQFVIGGYNIEYEGDTSPWDTCSKAILIIGKCNPSYAGNAFRVGFTDVWGGNYHSTGADYAEYFEWLDGNLDNEDRRGLFVTLKGEKIKIAAPNDDFILGIVSGNPSIVGDSHDDQWNKMYVSDIFGTPVYEEVEVPAETDEDGNVIAEAHIETRQKVNPDYDSSQKYVSRSERPEWDAVGMMGKLVAVDDGSCNVNGYCRVGENGTAAHSDKPTKFRVMKRLDGCHILVLVV